MLQELLSVSLCRILPAVSTLERYFLSSIQINTNCFRTWQIFMISHAHAPCTARASPSETKNASLFSKSKSLLLSPHTPPLRVPASRHCDTLAAQTVDSRKQRRCRPTLVRGVSRAERKRRHIARTVRPALPLAPCDN